MKKKYEDIILPIEQRVLNMVSEMTLDEKVSQMVHKAPLIDRLKIPEYNWWNECLHGVARAGNATVFPQAIGLAASWDRDLLKRVAEVISDEARAKHHHAKKKGNFKRFYGLTFWSPTINIFRDPRWGRGQETYGEDPYLTGEMGATFIKGLQGNDPYYLKLIATPKHFAVHSGPENIRHHFNVNVTKKDMAETYLPAFKKCVIDGKACSIMTAYTRLNGQPCSANKTLLIDILRNKWGFKGFVVSDCGAIDDIYKAHKVVKTAAEASALAINNGCELSCGNTFKALVSVIPALSRLTLIPL